MTWAPDYVTPEEARAYLRIDDALDDLQLAMWITTASRAVDRCCHRQFGQVGELEARVYPSKSGYGTCAYVAQIDDVQDITGLEVLDDAGESVIGPVLTPLNAAAEGRPFTRLVLPGSGQVAVTALWGWAAVPEAVKTATLLQTARLAVRRDSPYGIAGSPSEGGEMRLLASLDPDLRVALRPYVRTAWRFG